jgi:hypothetical protein
VLLIVDSTSVRVTDTSWNIEHQETGISAPWFVEANKASCPRREKNRAKTLEGQKGWWATRASVEEYNDRIWGDVPKWLNENVVHIPSWGDFEKPTEPLRLHEGRVYLRKLSDPIFLPFPQDYGYQDIRDERI